MEKRKFAVDWNQKTKKFIDSNSKKSFDDDRFYYPKMRDDGTAASIIRFLPSPDTDTDTIKLFTHGFEDVGGWYINNCPTTIYPNDYDKCPVCKYNGPRWDGYNDEEKRRSRTTNYYTNILVVKDPQTPENEGKVFLFRFGKTINDKILEKISPPKDDIEQKKPVYIFDAYDGLDFKLIIKQKKTKEKSYPNYDGSNWTETPRAIAESDDGIEKIYNKRYNLSEFIAPDKFKPFNELEEKFFKVIGQPIGYSTTGEERHSTPTPAESPVKNTPLASSTMASAPVTEKREDIKIDKASEQDFFAGLKDGD